MKIIYKNVHVMYIVILSFMIYRINYIIHQVLTCYENKMIIMRLLYVTKIKNSEKYIYRTRKWGTEHTNSPVN